MIRLITALAAAAVVTTPALAQTQTQDASMMTCADYMELQEQERSDVLASLGSEGGAGGSMRTGASTGGETGTTASAGGTASGGTMTSGTTTGAGGTAGTGTTGSAAAARATADVSAEQIMAVCEGNDSMMLMDAAEEARSQ